MVNKILFLTSANKKVGVGHIMRTIRFSKKICHPKNKLLLIIKEKEKKFSNKMFDKTYNIVSFNKIYDQILKVKPNLLIIDLPKPKNYESKIVKNTKLLLGPKYFPINSNFYKKNILPEVKNIFIFLGGGQNNLKLINNIFNVISNSKLKNCNINFISMAKIDNVVKQKLKKKHGLDLNFINNTKNIYQIIRKSDLSIITSGSVSFESCFFNVPMILISVANNQIKIAKTWNKLKVGSYVGKWSAKNFKTILKCAIDNLNSYKKRLKMSKIQSKVFNLKHNYIVNLVNNLNKNNNKIVKTLYN